MYMYELYLFTYISILKFSYWFSYYWVSALPFLSECYCLCLLIVCCYIGYMAYAVLLYTALLRVGIFFTDYFTACCYMVLFVFLCWHMLPYILLHVATWCYLLQHAAICCHMCPYAVVCNVLSCRWFNIWICAAICWYIYIYVAIGYYKLLCDVSCFNMLLFGVI